jgi:hypothetical protein
MRGTYENAFEGIDLRKTDKRRYIRHGDEKKL